MASWTDERATGGSSFRWWRLRRRPRHGLTPIGREEAAEDARGYGAGVAGSNKIRKDAVVRTTPLPERVTRIVHFPGM